MDLSIRMRIIYNVKHGYAICLKFGVKLVNSLTKSVLEARSESQYLKNKENLLLYCWKFSAFVVVVVI